jgi:hypothetical protein
MGKKLESSKYGAFSLSEKLIILLVFEIDKGPFKLLFSPGEADTFVKQ